MALGASEHVMRLLALLCALATAVRAQDATRTVFKPEALQTALRQGVKHVVIARHLDLTGLPRMYANSVANTAVAYVSNGTDTIRVRSALVCMSEAQSCERYVWQAHVPAAARPRPAFVLACTSLVAKCLLIWVSSCEIPLARIHPSWKGTLQLRAERRAVASLHSRCSSAHACVRTSKHTAATLDGGAMRARKYW
jgi:hypothetical protein